MKKFLVGAFALLCFGFSAVAQDIPAFTGKGAERAMLIDIKAAGKVKDNIVVVNMATSKELTFDVFVYDNSQGWIAFGSGTLERFNDTCKIEATRDEQTKKRTDFGKYSYAAVVLDDNAKYSFKTQTSHGDLYLCILPADISYDVLGKGAVELDVKKIQKRIKDNIRFVSKSMDTKNTVFYLYGDKGNGFELIATAVLKNFRDTCYAERCDGDIPPKSYSKFAVVSNDGKTYKYTAKAESNDLYIYVEN